MADGRASAWTGWRRSLQGEDVQRLRLALRRLASIDDEDAARFLLFVPPLPVGGPSGLASLAAAAVVATIEKVTPATFPTTFWRHHADPSLVSRDLQYRLALVFSRDLFERATSLASVLAQLKLEADPDEIGGLMLGSAEVLHRYRAFFRDLALRIDDSTPEIHAKEVPPPPPSQCRCAKSFGLAELRSAIEAVMAARGPAGTVTSDWRSNKARQVLAWAAATAFGQLTIDQAKAQFEAEGRYLESQ